MRFYPPFMLLFFLFAVFMLIFLFILIQLHVITFAFEKLGFSTFGVFVLLTGSLIGSLINIPVKEIPCDREAVEQEIVFWGMRYRVPSMSSHCTMIAINAGGAVIPSLVSLYLWLKSPSLITPLIATAVVALVIQAVSRPVKGLGIATPVFIPPLVTIIVALILAPADTARVAYIAGTMGTLIGADILNFNKIKNLGAPLASIGGAGTFDGIFLTGILSVLLV